MEIDELLNEYNEYNKNKDCKNNFLKNLYQEFKSNLNFKTYNQKNENKKIINENYNKNKNKNIVHQFFGQKRNKDYEKNFIIQKKTMNNIDIILNKYNIYCSYNEFFSFYFEYTENKEGKFIYFVKNKENKYNNIQKQHDFLYNFIMNLKPKNYLINGKSKNSILREHFIYPEIFKEILLEKCIIIDSKLPNIYEIIQDNNSNLIKINIEYFDKKPIIDIYYLINDLKLDLNLKNDKITKSSLRNNFESYNKAFMKYNDVKIIKKAIFLKEIKFFLDLEIIIPSPFLENNKILACDSLIEEILENRFIRNELNDRFQFNSKNETNKLKRKDNSNNFDSITKKLKINENEKFFSESQDENNFIKNIPEIITIKKDNLHSEKNFENYKENIFLQMFQTYLKTPDKNKKSKSKFLSPKKISLNKISELKINSKKTTNIEEFPSLKQNHINFQIFLNEKERKNTNLIEILKKNFDLEFFYFDCDDFTNIIINENIALYLINYEEKIFDLQKELFKITQISLKFQKIFIVFQYNIIENQQDIVYDLNFKNISRTFISFSFFFTENLIFLNSFDYEETSNLIYLLVITQNIDLNYNEIEIFLKNDKNKNVLNMPFFNTVQYFQLYKIMMEFDLNFKNIKENQLIFLLEKIFKNSNKENICWLSKCFKKIFK